MTITRRWTKDEDKLLGTMTDAALAKRLGCATMTVFKRRHALKIAPLRPSGGYNKWGVTELAMLGRWPDEELAQITGRSLAEVQAKRLEL
jgi:hypothetical protein